jgi:homoserine/homoserine lactone efflux protein
VAADGALSWHRWQHTGLGRDGVFQGSLCHDLAMIDPSLFLAFAVAVTLLMLFPGPNVSLLVANSIAYGPRYGFLTLAGTVSAMVVQLCLTVFGMTQLLSTMGFWFEWLRWIGVAYLIYLGVAQWRAEPVDLTRTRAQPKSARSIYTRAFLVSGTNPKTLLFYGAFFPQFVSMDHPVGPQLAALLVTCFLISVAVDAGWVLVAGRARGVLGSRGRLRNRLSGGFMVGAGVALAFARNK